MLLDTAAKDGHGLMPPPGALPPVLGDKQTLLAAPGVRWGGGLPWHGACLFFAPTRRMEVVAGRGPALSQCKLRSFS